LFVGEFFGGVVIEHLGDDEEVIWVGLDFGALA